ncbi:MAG: glycoside hydrolase family 20 zincin-like fold domain-containing protein [Candidatus Kapaibacteriales bacterium]
MKKLLTFIFVLFFYQLLYSQDIYTIIPRPRTSFEISSAFTISNKLEILFLEKYQSKLQTPIDFLSQQLKERIPNLTIEQIPVTNTSSSAEGIFIIFDDSLSESSKFLQDYLITGEDLSIPESYLLQIEHKKVIIASFSIRGIYNGIATLLQLSHTSNEKLELKGCHIFDYPDYPIRWVYVGSNLRGKDAIVNLKKILDTIAILKLNGIQHTDFKYTFLTQQPRNYFDSLRLFKQLAETRNIEIIPGVAPFGWSNSFLYNDPNLAEGLPNHFTVVVLADTFQLVPDQRMKIPNGGFENVNSKNKFTGWYFYDDKYITQDKSIFHSGNASAKATNFDGGNVRVCARLECQQFRGYLLSAYLKTENIKGGFFQLLALGKDKNGKTRQLTFTSLTIPSTSNNWIKVETIFNTLNSDTVLLYCGSWGPTSGTFWMDDFEVKDLGLMNVLRREGTPLLVINRRTNDTLTEGFDFTPIVDTLMLTTYIEMMPSHKAPTIRKLSNRVLDGDTLDIFAYHPFIAVSNNIGQGSVMVCPSETKTYEIVKTQIHWLDSLYSPKRYFMNHDEIRNMNWDLACQFRKMSPAELLADNVLKCIEIIHSKNKDAEIFVWSDMFDSTHNAKKDYYLVNGDLTGIWKLIPKEIIIANWNSGKLLESLNFFSNYGFRQITTPYYDDRSTKDIRRRRLAQSNLNNINGMMYTTWANDYSFLTPFSFYAWGAGPSIYHKPLTNDFIWAKDTLHFSVKALPDPYDQNDTIVSVYLIIEFKIGPTSVRDTFNLKKLSRDSFSIVIPKYWGKIYQFRYQLVAKNTQQLQRETPFYSYTPTISSFADTMNNSELKSIFLTKNNPYLSLPFETSKIAIYDVFGREVYQKTKFNSFEIDLSEIATKSKIFFVKCYTSKGILFLKLLFLK